MSDYLLKYFFPLGIFFLIISTIYFTVKKHSTIKHYKNSTSKRIKNITGLITDYNGFLSRKVQWCRFEILINENSIFIFPQSLYFIPIRSINLIFSNSERKYIKSSQILREVIINNHSVSLIYYPPFLISGKRIIKLENLKFDEIKIFEELKIHKNY